MEFDIRRLTPALAEDYVRFFDETPHDDDVAEHKCYCVCWCSDDYEGKDFSTAAKRRQAALQYVRSGALQGYLAYSGGKPGGWCNANTKVDCLQCCSWRRNLDYVPLDAPDESSKVKSIFCFVIAPEWKRRGIATALLERVCADAAREGFVFAEAYPYRDANWQSSDFGGHLEMYQKSGFHVSAESAKGLVMRKAL